MKLAVELNIRHLFRYYVYPLVKIFDIYQLLFRQKINELCMYTLVAKRSYIQRFVAIACNIFVQFLRLFLPLESIL